MKKSRLRWFWTFAGVDRERHAEEAATKEEKIRVTEEVYGCGEGGQAGSWRERGSCRGQEMERVHARDILG